MRATVIKAFRDKGNGRVHRKRDVITISKSRFDDLKGKFVDEAPKDAKLTPKRDNNGQCIICKNKV